MKHLYVTLTPTSSASVGHSVRRVVRSPSIGSKWNLSPRSSGPGGWRRIVRDFARTVCFNEMLDGFTEILVSRLSGHFPAIRV